MSKIKTREKGKDINVLDKSAVVGQRMKNAFIRSKRNAAALMDDRQAIGHGTASTPAWSGAPALSVGAPTSAGIWTLA